MKVSFIIPVYKPDFDVFTKCLTSLKEQSYKDTEVIIALDGPDADAERIAKDILPTAKILKCDKKGVQRTRNVGGAAAQGDLLWFWDCDCVIEPDTCKAFVDEFKANPDVDFIYSGYKFLGENGGIPSEPFDPWLLKCANYISTCFPMRKKVYPGWDEKLESLQDWDLWLTIVKNGGKGQFIPGYAFSTLLPKGNSISALGCNNKAWLPRVKAVKDKHGLPDRKICVTSLSYKHEAIRLAKLIDADYKDFPHLKPNNYETVIQVGFSLHPKAVQMHADIFGQPVKKRVIFWTADNIAEIYNQISLKALTDYANGMAHVTHYVEDLKAKNLMERAGFNVSIMPMPLENKDEVKPSKEKRILVDITTDARQLLTCLEYSLPDFKFDYICEKPKPINEYSTFITLVGENTMSQQVKRALLSGLNVFSNVKSPFCGYINDVQGLGEYVSEWVDTIRKRYNKDTTASVNYWKGILSKEKLMKALEAQ